MATPSPLPSDLDPSEVWSNVRVQWQGLDPAGPNFTEESYELFRPYIMDAARRVGLNFSYLLHESDIVVRIMPLLAKKEELPSKIEFFRIFLDSAILRITHTAQDVRFCDLRDPLAPWVEFCNRVNRLRPSFRRYLLVFLPFSEMVPSMPGIEIRKPGTNWTGLWDSLTDGIPLGCLPKSWVETRASAMDAKKSVAEYESVLILPNKSISKQLGEILHRAAGLAESNRIGRTALELPKGVIPENPVAFSKELQELLKSSGGMPQDDSNLEAALNSILNLNNGLQDSIFLMQPESLLDCSEEVGFDAFKTFMLRGSILDRSGNSDGALWQFHKGIRAAGSRKQIGQSLANLAIQAFVARDNHRARYWIAEAWKYSPNCSFVASCKTYIQQALKNPEDQRGENIA